MNKDQFFAGIETPKNVSVKYDSYKNTFQIGCDDQPGYFNAVKLMEREGDSWLSIAYPSMLKQSNLATRYLQTQRYSEPIPSLTLSPYTKANQSAVQKAIDSSDQFELFEVAREDYNLEKAQWIKDNIKEIRAIDREIKRQISVVNLAQEAGVLNHVYDGESHEIVIRDYVWKKRDLRKYLATGKYLAVVDVIRTRTYSKSCNWKESTRTDTFLVGRNENGNAFSHQIRKDITGLDLAVSWIWRNKPVTRRHGDVGLVPSNLKKEGNHQAKSWGNHNFIGELYQNGRDYIRSGILTHSKRQHQYLEIDDQWHEVVIGRRSETGFGTAD
jgi:hypothetical protein